MAVKTVFNKEDFKNILYNYNLGELISVDPILSGTVQTNYLIKTTKEKIILRYYENRIKESVLFEVNLLEYLNEKEYICPSPIKNINGEYTQIYKEKPYVLYKYIEGYHKENSNDEEIKDLIEIVAKLNILTKEYKPLYTEFRDNYDIAFCKRKCEEIALAFNSENVRAKLTWYKEQLEKLKLPKLLTKGVCHCDLNLENVLYKEGQINALIDFDDANYTYLVFDIIRFIDPFKIEFAWDTWSNFNSDDNVFDFTKSKEYIKEYIKYRELEDIEKYHLFDVFKLSILIDCLWYFTRGDVQDFYEKRKIEYLDKLGREQFYNYIFK